MGGEATGRLDLCSQWQITPDSGFIRPFNKPVLEEPNFAMPALPNSGVWPGAQSLATCTSSGPSALFSVSTAAASRGLLDHHTASRSMQFNHLLPKQEAFISSNFPSMLGQSTSSLGYDRLPQTQLFGSPLLPNAEHQLVGRSSLNSFSYDDGLVHGSSSSGASRERGKQQLPPPSGPAQANGGSLVLDVSKGELINLSKLTPQEILDAKALAASKSHSEAERRRRERINTHLATLRNNLPSSTKTDKASLLGEVIDHLKFLKRQAADIAEGGPVPSDVDELTVDVDPSSSEIGDGRTYYRASLCCDDRPDLYPDLMRTLHTLRLQTVKAEIATLGGRIKNVLLMTRSDEGSDEDDKEALSVSSVMEALRAVMERSGLGDQSPGSSNKRQRLASLDSSSPSM
ncbi:protein MpBHLH7 [Marchantia polymorpha subsp. ruderalis]|uniref:BHLH domain-containing protein n=2 Tax=Marchantia polymorpha TaxID=3197 RepID=A0AAF6B1R5_MARPO|nr:hypothetical protein MARPO_0039s0068 [Marchantia polymorpha]BBN05949.1 hypothetical protein Mp_3g17260 [Marchantia polymorpha subsp. ruderalis]|eukprot:PTQ40575.1 hypothetical protein MARPO_0039s0068 [Marchantia polymorpha]